MKNWLKERLKDLGGLVTGEPEDDSSILAGVVLIVILLAAGFFAAIN